MYYVLIDSVVAILIYTFCNTVESREFFAYI